MSASRSSSRRFRAPPLLALLAGGGLVLGLPTDAAARDDVLEAPPVLVSTKGGGDSWSTIAELIEAAEAGNPIACFQYADLLETGHLEVKADPARALDFYAQAAADDYAPALFRLAKIYHDALLGQRRDYGRALDYYRRAAAAGSVEATYNVGAMYVSGRGVKRDYAEGLAWLLLAAERGADAAPVDQVKQRLRKRPDLIAAAEKRLPQLRQELAAGAEGATTKTPPPAPGTPPALSVAPPAPDLPRIAPTAPTAPTPLPSLAPTRPMIGVPAIAFPPPPSPPAPPADPAPAPGGRR